MSLLHKMDRIVFIRHNFISFFLQSLLYKRRLKRSSSPVPPPRSIKENTVRFYGKKTNFQTFIETGTFLGDMILAVKNKFEKIYSIELSNKLHSRAKEYFKKNKHITCLQGDSGIELQKLLGKINNPCLFWLDAHYSGGITAKGTLDTPIVKELEYIFNHPCEGHLILIDDARFFVGKDGYPEISELESYVKKQKIDYTFFVKNDIIHIVPPAASES